MKDVPAAIVAALAAGLALLSAAGAASAQTNVAAGAITYQVYCQSCHGASGEGDGALAANADPAPIDLTLLAAANDGVFPRERVAAAIDGREETVGHTGVAMPPWARLFAHDMREVEGPALERLVRRRIDNLVAYIESIQR